MIFFQRKQDLIQKKLEIEEKKVYLEQVLKDNETQITQKVALSNDLESSVAESDKQIKELLHKIDCKISELQDRTQTLDKQEERLTRLKLTNEQITQYKDHITTQLDDVQRNLNPAEQEIAKLTAELDGNSEEIRNITRSSDANKAMIKTKEHHVEVLRHKLENAEVNLSKKKKSRQ